jgi:hypothetical protein
LAVPVQRPCPRAKQQRQHSVQVVAYAAVGVPSVIDQPPQLEAKPLPRNVENIADDPS